MSRYAGANFLPGAQGLETTAPGYRIWKACIAGAISFTVHTLQEGERLDHLAGQHYGDGTLWWVIAGASGIGWGLQIPAGTFIRIPTSMQEVGGYL